MLQAYESNYLLKQEIPTQVFFCEKTPEEHLQKAATTGFLLEFRNDSNKILY